MSQSNRKYSLSIIYEPFQLEAFIFRLIFKTLKQEAFLFLMNVRGIKTISEIL